MDDENKKIIKLFPDSFNEVLHSNLWPIEVKNTTGIEVNLKIDSFQINSQDFCLLRLSPLGAELIVDRKIALTLSSSIDLDLKTNGQVTQFKNLRPITKTESDNGNCIIGVRWFDEEKKSSIEKKWICGDLFLPIGVAPNPYEYNDLILFRIAEVDGNNLILMTSLRNKFLFPGTRLDCILTLPLSGSWPMKLKIESARISSQNAKEFLLLGGSIQNMSEDLKQALTDFVFQFSTKETLTSFRRVGQYPKNIEKSISHSFVKSAQEYEEVIKLRCDTYKGYIAAGEVLSKSDVQDIYDSRARILLTKHNGKAIATLRIVFHGPNDQIEQAENIKIPFDFPRNDELAEISRLCVAQEYRVNSVMLEMIKRCLVVMIQANRYWLVASAPDNLVKTYKLIGARFTGISYKKHFKGIDFSLHVILVNVLDCVKGKGIGPITWNIVFREVFEHVLDKGVIDLDPLSKIRIAIYKAFKPISDMVIKRKFETTLKKVRRKLRNKL